MLIREHTLQLHTVENQAWAQVPEQSTGTGLLGRNASPHLSEGRTGAAVAGNGASLEHVRQGLLTLHTVLSTMQDPSVAANLARAHIHGSVSAVNSESTNESPDVQMTTSSMVDGPTRSRTEQRLEPNLDIDQILSLSHHPLRPVETSQDSLEADLGEAHPSTNLDRLTPSEDALEAAVAVAAARLRLRRSLARAGTVQAGTHVPVMPCRRPRDNRETLEIAGETDVSRTPTFYSGQWLDVEDTVHQWLEATVMRVRSRRMLVFPEQMRSRICQNI